MNIYTALLIGLSIGLSTASQSCGPKFSSKCTCGKMEYDNKPQFVVNCTNTGFTNTSYLEYMPANTEVLIFTGNFIPELPWNVFGSINNYSNLNVVDMSNNRIQNIRGKSYHHVPNVQRLILNHNNLSISRDDGGEFNHHHARVFSNFINLKELHLTNAFSENTSEQLSEDLHDIFVNSNLSKITKLHLEQNEIVKFKDRNVFCDLPSLKDLHLGDNYLREINFNLLCLKHLRFLDLERNKFKYVKIKDMNLMNTLQNSLGRTTNLTVDFTYNKFVCDCNLSAFADWIRGTNVTVRNKESLTCEHSDTNVELLLLLTIKKCKINSLSVHSTPLHQAALIFFTSMFIVLLVLIVGSLIYKNRDRIKRIVNPVLDTVSKKVQYTTIKDEECQEIHV
ncbi:hypothetical protein HA402_014682 [Bradysia odoriphaga]|nr:hypothetical protein HA402_014682 [Bradysia odoriphaga]